MAMSRFSEEENFERVTSCLETIEGLQVFFSCHASEELSIATREKQIVTSAIEGCKISYRKFSKKIHDRVMLFEGIISLYSSNEGIINVDLQRLFTNEAIHKLCVAEIFALLQYIENHEHNECELKE
jgi:hypothetical protein